MILDVKQISKDLFYANFVINRGTQQAGYFDVQGSILSNEGVIKGNIFGQNFEMKFIKFFQSSSRDYNIFFDEILRGQVYQTLSDDSFFKRYDYSKMYFDDNLYELFSVGLGKKGTKSPIYFNNQQVAQIDKDTVVYNDLHEFKIYSIDEYTSKIAVLFCAYKYIYCYYQSGEKLIKSKCTTVEITTNKSLKQKYNPLFVTEISL